MNRLKELRKSKGYTLKEVERKTNIPHKTYDNYEILRTEPKLATWEKLAEFYDVDPEYLVGWSDVKKKGEIN
ncbi:helix-turn-helix domain-containing protein [Leuconostoc gasicomitatum]|uniref:helix-turn-helix domain-containing protein n=1 Tax=Leuconostoc gasicomitatum TaxID=115778 RepID=UPI001CC4BCD8|nr:helix-turn-helix transcriptional regulator [Leuconostoc gasicomitatum]MBR2276868.1 helix-turn-helix transcriptional regulator [Leuconostoc sp.]MBZ5969000.1 helix-turn-helix transcriptional regulator [Leuconostoc gasicomitatum]